jgi:putative oxidoreductase
MLANLRKPHYDLASLVLRLGLAAVFITHGYIKIRQQNSWTNVIPREMQQAVAWGEFACGCALLVGLLSRLAAVGIIVDMAGALYYVTGWRDFVETEVGRHGFNFKTAGFEYNAILITMAVAVILLGGGAASLDRLIFGPRRRRVTAPPAPGGTLPPEMVVSQR